MHVFLVIKECPILGLNVERVFKQAEAAHDFIEDSYPYYIWYEDQSFYALGDDKGGPLADKLLEDEVRHYVKLELVEDADEK